MEFRFHGNILGRRLIEEWLFRYLQFMISSSSSGLSKSSTSKRFPSAKSRAASAVLRPKIPSDGPGL
jgi:hypothetical protein